MKETAEQRRIRMQRTIMGAKSGRYMVIRILASVLFFTDLYWAYLLLACGGRAALIAPVLGAASAVCALAEAGRCVSHASERGYEYMAITHKAMIASCALSGVVALVTAFAGTGVFFPFFALPVYGIAATLAASMVKLGLVYKIIAVRDRTDKRYESYLRYVKLAREQKGR